VAVGVVPPAELAASDAPLALVYRRATGSEPTVLGVIGVISMVNGALVQVIMFSRILYGLAKQGSLPAIFATVHARTRTPIVSTAAAATIIAVLALGLPLTVLARWTSTLMLCAFTVVNAALIGLKRRDPRPDGILLFPAWVPIVGFSVSLAFLVYGVIDLLS
jgi:amino acid transporter